jgi:hypothetical protein
MINSCMSLSSRVSSRSTPSTTSDPFPVTCIFGNELSFIANTLLLPNLILVLLVLRPSVLLSYPSRKLHRTAFEMCYIFVNRKVLLHGRRPHKALFDTCPEAPQTYSRDDYQPGMPVTDIELCPNPKQIDAYMPMLCAHHHKEG